jgi:Ca-activated chloride channel family protein
MVYISTLAELCLGASVCFFLLIPAVPLLFIIRWLIHSRFRTALTYCYSHASSSWSPVNLLRFVPDTLMRAFA